MSPALSWLAVVVVTLAGMWIMVKLAEISEGGDE